MTLSLGIHETLPRLFKKLLKSQESLFNFWLCFPGLVQVTSCFPGPVGLHKWLLSTSFDLLMRLMFSYRPCEVTKLHVTLDESKFEFHLESVKSWIQFGHDGEQVGLSQSSPWASEKVSPNGVKTPKQAHFLLLMES